jgi:hypothetical protein
MSSLIDDRTSWDKTIHEISFPTAYIPGPITEQRMKGKIIWSASLSTDGFLHCVVQMELVGTRICLQLHDLAPSNIAN